MKALETKEINFMNDVLVAAKSDGGLVYTGVRRMCKTLGMSKGQADLQVKNVRKDVVLSQGAARFDKGVFDSCNAAIGLQIEYVPMWLAKISITPAMQKESPEVVSRLVEYQLKAVDLCELIRSEMNASVGACVQGEGAGKLITSNWNLSVFSNPEFGSIRTTVINGEPWFVGKDVALALGYSNPQKAIRDHVDDEDKGVNVSFTPGGEQELIIINESGLYSLVLGSKLPEAKKFKRWITSEVLPAIRKTSAYIMPDVKTPTVTSDVVAKLVKVCISDMQRDLENQQEAALKAIMNKVDEIQNTVDHGLEAVTDKLTALASRPAVRVEYNSGTFDMDKTVEREAKHPMWRRRFNVSMREIARLRDPIEPNSAIVYGEAYKRFEHDSGVNLKEAVNTLMNYRRMRGDSEDDVNSTNRLEAIACREDWIAVLVRVGIEMTMEAHLPYGEGSM